MNDSQRLLAEYARTGSEAAFSELVNRYIDLVYSTAVRLLDGDTHQARDVSQVVFVDLARKAATFSAEVLLGGWLHRHTCFVVANLRRSERRRQSRERKALEMNTQQDHSPENLAQAKGVLDDAINELSAHDRTAVLLRFFEQYDFRSLGEALGSSENAAQKRVARALEELRSLLTRRGVSLSVAALATVLAGEAVSAAPVGLAAAISGGALTAAAATSATTFTLWKVMVMTKLKLGILSAIVVAGVATPLVVQHRTQSSLREKENALRVQGERLSLLEAENEQLSNKVAQIKSTSARPADQSAELLRLRGEVAMLRQQTNELAKLQQEHRKLLAQAGSQADTNQVSLDDRLILRQKHTVDALTVLLTAVKSYATNHNGQFPSDLAQLAASSELTASNFAGNLRLDDFEFTKSGAVDPNGGKIILGLRVPLQTPDGGSVMVAGGISDDGVPHTSTWNLSPQAADIPPASAKRLLPFPFSAFFTLPVSSFKFPGPITPNCFLRLTFYASISLVFPIAGAVKSTL